MHFLQTLKSNARETAQEIKKHIYKCVLEFIFESTNGFGLLIFF